MSDPLFRETFWFQPALFSTAECEAITTKAARFASQDATIFSTASNAASLRTSQITWLTDQELQDRLWHYVNQANHAAFGCDVTNHADLQFTSYHGHQAGHYDWHNDVKWHGTETVDRKLSVTVQLSDPDSYEGGQFEFDELTTSLDLRRQGSVLIFPSFVRHKVSPVIRGTRHALVAWFTGPRWR